MQDRKLAIIASTSREMVSIVVANYYFGESPAIVTRDCCVADFWTNQKPRCDDEGGPTGTVDCCSRLLDQPEASDRRLPQ
jgi:hypothetical protein